MFDILKAYGRLLQEVDEWFARCMERFPDRISCGQKCSGCCRGLFDITLLDAAYLKLGFDKLEEGVRTRVLEKVERQIQVMRESWPEFSPPYILNLRPEDEWEILMPDEDETPCPLLDEEGRCLVYACRPMTCRLHGLPLIDDSGELFHDEWCTLNFEGCDPLPLSAGLKWRFNHHFQEELLLFQDFTRHLFNHSFNELDTFIPTALLIDFDKFDWKRWAKYHLNLEEKA